MLALSGSEMKLMDVFFVALTTGRLSVPFPLSKLYSSPSRVAATPSSVNSFLSRLASDRSSPLPEQNLTVEEQSKTKVTSILL